MRAQRSGRGLLGVAAKLTSFVERWRGLAEPSKRANPSRPVALTGIERPGNRRAARSIAGEARMCWLVH